MGTSETAKGFSAARALALLLAVILLAACSGETGQNGKNQNRREEPRNKPSTTAARETTAEEPPRITLGDEPGGRPEVVLRLEGGPKTTFSGLCSVGDDRNVLGGRVPKRFTFDPGGRALSCRIQKRDEGRGALKVILIAGDTTRSVQQTNAPRGVINLSYDG